MTFAKTNTEAREYMAFICSVFPHRVRTISDKLREFRNKRRNKAILSVDAAMIVINRWIEFLAIVSNVFDTIKHFCSLTAAGRVGLDFYGYLTTPNYVWIRC